eukprot:CAMPEP_0119117556 /NCGR_PEP_ID=MMETSP1180-20130426/52906_1 /TAXON_ID=3052 ORGANISM="Chlamydomonas cf sp, Strain CCMP681" /NCGR_SAMPLE_ID=MMETSP1180 /ASSEMBLY_ACC=CAM_ASM_000741 /LENGTH=123 /DNA_ID=CAMNT_0007106829 /DNA_START=619 /DNA_END=986 /DNA_ORIENTATION=-
MTNQHLWDARKTIRPAKYMCVSSFHLSQCFAPCLHAPLGGAHGRAQPVDPWKGHLELAAIHFQAVAIFWVSVDDLNDGGPEFPGVGVPVLRLLPDEVGDLGQACFCQVATGCQGTDWLWHWQA